MRTVAQLQSSHDVTTGDHSTGLTARRDRPERVNVGTALPQGLFQKAQAVAQEPAKAKRQKRPQRPHDVPAHGKKQTDFSRFTRIGVSLWSKFPEDADQDNDGFPSMRVTTICQKDNLSL